MIIKSSRYDLKFNTKVEDLVTKESVINNEAKLLGDKIIQESKKKKYVPTPVIEETITGMAEGKIEDEDLSEWLKDDIDE